jgi:hypothetical protein
LLLNLLVLPLVEGLRQKVVQEPLGTGALAQLGLVNLAEPSPTVEAVQVFPP